MADSTTNLDTADPVNVLLDNVDDAIKRFGDFGRASDTDPRLIPRSDNWYAIQVFDEWAHIAKVADFVVADNASFFDTVTNEWRAERDRFISTVGAIVDKKRDDPFGELTHDEAFSYWEETRRFAVKVGAVRDIAVDDGITNAISAIDGALKELPDRINSVTSEIAELLAGVVANALEGSLTGLIKGLGVFGVTIGIIASGLTIWYIVKNRKAVE